MIGIYLALLDTDEEKSRFEELYMEYRDVMYNYAYNILTDPYLAEDAVHNAFLSLTRNLDKITAVKCIKTRNYLIIIVRNAALKLYNSKKQNYVEDIDNEIIVSAENVEYKAEINENTDRIFRLIKGLDSIYSDVLVLKLFYEMSDNEIAALLGITVENARIRIFRGRNQLKKMLAEESQYDGL